MYRVLGLFATLLALIALLSAAGTGNRELWGVTAVGLFVGGSFAFLDIRALRRAALPQAKGETMAIEFADIEDSAVDLASKIAAEVMGLPWTHGGDQDEHCDRYGQLQEVISRALEEHKAVPAPLRRCGKCPLPAGR